MLITPTTAALVSTNLALIRLPPATWSYRSLTWFHTPSPPSTPYSRPTAIIHTTNIATDSTSVNFIVVHGSMCFSCSRARRGPLRPAAFDNAVRTLLRGDCGGGTPTGGRLVCVSTPSFLMVPSRPTRYVDPSGPSVPYGVGGG